MQASTAAFDTTIAGSAMTVTATVTINLPVPAYNDVTLAVDAITVDRQTTTDMPAATRLITGYPAASAQLTLSGLIDQTDASKTIAWLLNPANSVSPLYRQDILGAAITIQAGLALPGSATPETFAIFTGIVDDYTVNMHDGTVTLACLDNRAVMSGAVTVPAAFDGGITPASGAGSTSYGFNTGAITASWVLNYLLEKSGTYLAPPPRPQQLVRQTLHGGVWPEIGPSVPQVALDVRSFGSPSRSSGYVAGKFSPAVPATPLWSAGTAVGSSAYPLSAAIPGWFFGTTKPLTYIAWIKYDPNKFVAPTFVGQWNVYTSNTRHSLNLTPGDIPSGGNIALSVFWTTIDTGLSGSQGVGSVPGDNAWHQIAIGYTYTTATNLQVKYWLDGVPTATTNINTAAQFSMLAYDFIANMSVLHVGGGIVMESIQVSNETDPTVAGLDSGWVPEPGSIDASLNTLAVVPDTSRSDQWAVIQQIAEAELGVAGFDEMGAFRFYNRDTLQGRTSSRSVTPTYSLRTLDQQVGRSFVRNHIQVPVNAVQLSAFGAVWNAPNVIQIPANGIYTTIATTTTPAVAVATNTGVIPPGGLALNTSGYRAAPFPDGTGGSFTNLLMTVTPLTSTTTRITVSNPNGFTMYLLTPTVGGFPAGSVGQPALSLGGYAVTLVSQNVDSTTGSSSGASLVDVQFPALQDGGAASSARGDQLLAVPSNLWVQDQGLATTIANDLLVDLYRPKPLWRNVQIVADPRLQLTDRATIADLVTTQVNDDAYIFGVHTTISRTAWAQSLDLRAIATPGGWLLGVAGRSELAVTTYL